MLSAWQASSGVSTRASFLSVRVYTKPEAAGGLTFGADGRSQFKCQLAKLPKKVQGMTISEFFAQVCPPHFSPFLQFKAPQCCGAFVLHLPAPPSSLPMSHKKMPTDGRSDRRN